MIRPVKLSDAGRLADIYNYYIEHSTATFEEAKISAIEMSKRIEKIIKNYPFLIITTDTTNEIVGYAYANQWRDRSAYRYTAETTVYLHHDFSGQGIGTSLYKELLAELDKMKIHSAIGGITLPNDGSVALHEKMGYTKTAHFHEVGLKFGQWLDVGYWERISPNQHD